MPSNLRFGYGLDFRNPREWHKPWADLYAEHLEFVAWIDRLGFESVWLAEHHGIEDGYQPSPLIAGAAIAARTKTLRISTGVGLLPHYHPVRLAEDMAVLDILSNGRAEFAFGIGYLKHEAAAYGFKSRGRLADEMLQIIRRLWAGETVNFKGEFFDLSNARVTPLPIQKNGIPLFVGGAATPGFRRAARYGDGFIGAGLHYQLYLEQVRALGKDERATRYVSMGTDMWFIVSEDPEKTFHEVAPHAYYQVNKYGEWQAAVGADWGFKAMPFEEFKKSGMLNVFTPDQAIAHIRGRIAEVPNVEGYCMQAPAGYPLSKLAVHAELFAKKVMPAFHQNTAR